MLILGLLGMYFDAAVVFVTSQTLLFRLAVAILCLSSNNYLSIFAGIHGFCWMCHEPNRHLENESAGKKVDI